MTVLLEAPPAVDREHALLPFERLDAEAFQARYGPRPRATARLLAEVGAAGLTGRGGAGFPTARKLAAVRAGRRPVVVGNGTEGEPASFKDAALIDRNPHLVVDGALVAAELVGARRIVLAVGRGGGAGRALETALEERADAGRIEVVTAPERFVAGEESALVHFLNGGEAKPTATPPRPFERGVDGRPTLVQNVETLANLALVARYGSRWFAAAGTADEPGTVLATVTGAVARGGVLEVPLGSPLRGLFARCGGFTEPARAFLVGGYFGRWVVPDDGLRLSRAGLAAAGGTLGARAVVVLGASSCGVRETARVAGYMAAQSAGQCGPCVFGLGALADRLGTIARAEPGAPEAYSHLDRLARQIAGRGACAHPDGVLGFVASATTVFADEVALHLEGRCSARIDAPVLPTPNVDGRWR
jgi:NADH:ubiquinone oxidoreductase subunit F (NADH-binding)